MLQGIPIPDVNMDLDSSSFLNKTLSNTMFFGKTLSNRIETIVWEPNPLPTDWEGIAWVSWWVLPNFQWTGSDSLTLILRVEPTLRGVNPSYTCPRSDPKRLKCSMRLKITLTHSNKDVGCRPTPNPEHPNKKTHVSKTLSNHPWSLSSYHCFVQLMLQIISSFNFC